MNAYEKLTRPDFIRNQVAYDTLGGPEDAWFSQEQKMTRLGELVGLCEAYGVSFGGKTCLDVGCGTGDLILLLEKRGISSYLGVDIYEPSLRLAKQKGYGGPFVLADILTDAIDTEFDIVLSSGALTTNMASDNYEYLEAMITKMWSMTKGALAFNVLVNEEDNRPGGHAFSYDLDKVLEICKDIAPIAMIEAHYKEFDEEADI